MKKLFAIMLILCIGGLFGNAFGQETKTQNKKGGFAVGGYDNTRQTQEKSTVTKRSVVIDEEAQPAEKAMEVEAAESPKPAPAQAPPAAADEPQKEGQGSGQTISPDTKDKQKSKKNAKTKGRR